MSAIERGSVAIPSHSGLSLKFVASGREVYRFHKRTHVVDAGHFLIVPEGYAGDAEIDPRAGLARGLCVGLPATGSRPEPLPLEQPLLFPANCSALGHALSREFWRIGEGGPDVGLVRFLAFNVEHFLADAIRSLDSLSAKNAATRYENFRRVCIARGYLHDIGDRNVELLELARVSGLSRFHLARLFSDAFGVPPSAYHRALRLRRAREDLMSGRTNCTEAAMRHGFGDTAHFSRAYRTAYGHPPSAARQRA